MGDLLDLGLQPRHVRGDVAEPDLGRDGRGGASASSSSRQAASTEALIWLATIDAVPAAGCARTFGVMMAASLAVMT